MITPGFKSRSKYIIHAVGPIWRGGRQGEPELLRSAYINALDLAVSNHCRSVGFPLISSGIFGYPEQDAWFEALTACGTFLDEHPEVHIDIVFAVLSESVMSNGIKAFRQTGASKYKIADKKDWKTLEMPESHDTFVLARTFTADQMDALRRGNIPQEMEDKWFWYMENETLFAHRSWTGFCIYVIELKKDGNHLVTVNRDPDQYRCSDIEEDREALNKLLDWWTGPEYDHYNEWLSETVDMLKKAGKIKD